MREKILSDMRSDVDSDTTIREFCEDKEYSVGQLLYRFDTWTNAKNVAGVNTHSIECPNCGSLCQYLSNHWNKCGEPELSDKQKNILRGMLLSDGTVNEEGAFTAYSTNKKFIQWLSDELNFMAYPPVLNDGGEERYERNIKSGFDVERDANYSDMYAVSSPVHSFTENLRHWYDSGEKQIPEDFSINKIEAKLWYCGDGGIHWSGDNAYAEIRPLSFNNDSIEAVLDQLSFDYNIQSDGTVCFYGDSRDFLEWIGPAPKGMEYKWEIGDRSRYERLKPD